MVSLNVTDSPKSLRETLCVAQACLGWAKLTDVTTHRDRLSRLIDECDRHRPLGSDGKHGNLHTNTCGCEEER